MHKPLSLAIPCTMDERCQFSWQLRTSFHLGFIYERELDFEVNLCTTYQSKAVWFCWWRDPGIVWVGTLNAPVALDIAGQRLLVGLWSVVAAATFQTFPYFIAYNSTRKILFCSILGRAGRLALGNVQFQLCSVGAEAWESELCKGFILTTISSQLLQNFLSFWPGQCESFDTHFNWLSLICSGHFTLVRWSFAAGAWPSLHIRTSTERVWEWGRETEKTGSWCCKGDLGHF